MNNSELICFFKEYKNFTKFERIKKIYILTNDLDFDLLIDLKNEYSMYCYSLAVTIKKQLGKNILNDTQGNEKTYKRKSPLLQYYEKFIGNSEYSTIEEINKETYLFKRDLRDLINRKLSDLPENSRHRNNYNYIVHVDDKFGRGGIDYYSGKFLKSDTEENLLDLSDTSLVGRIIYLEKLGIIDFLRNQNPFSTSINSIATVFSAITGAKPTSIQPLLNPLLGKDVNNKNNPLFSTKNVLTVENLLSKIGFEVSKKK